MADKTDESEGAKAAEGASEQGAAPVEHSLLKKHGPDDILLSAYQKVEKKLTAHIQERLSVTVGSEIQLEPEEENKKASFESWLAEQDSASVFLQFQLGVIDTPIWVRIERSFLAASVDSFFGGAFDLQTEFGDVLSRSETGMVQRIGDAIAQALEKSWSVLCEVSIHFVDFVEDSTEIETSLDDENVLIASSSLEVSEEKLVVIDVVQPVDGLITMEPQLNRQLCREPGEADPVWQAALKDSVDQVYLPVRSVLARPTMQLSQLSELQVGDILPVAPTDNVPLIVADRVFAHGTIGEQNGGVAFKINQFL